MKFLKLIILIIISTTVMVACKKDKAQRTTLERMQGQWKFQKEIYNESHSGVFYSDTAYGLPGDYIDFRTNGKIHFKFGNFIDSANYILINESSFVTYKGPDRDTASIILLTDNQFQYRSIKFDPAPDFHEFTDFLTR